MWRHTTDFVAPSDGGDLVAGRNYVGIDGFNYIILSGTPGNFVGVTDHSGAWQRRPLGFRLSSISNSVFERLCLAASGLPIGGDEF